MNRQRLTWPDKKASAHPATPDEGPASPAYPGKDPEANDYKNGDTSSWAEDPTKGPYPQSAHPATPDEGPASPAYKAAAYEKKAIKCIRIATAMLGEKVTASVIEDQALSMMDLPDSSITATLKRLGLEEVEEEVEEEAKKKAGAEEEETEEKEEAKKKASDKISSLEGRMARLERILIRLAGEEEEEVEEEAKKKAGEEEEVEEEAKKKAAEEEEEVEEAKKKAGMMSEEEQMLEKMLKEEGMFGDTAAELAPPAPKEEACGEMEVELGGMDDPMGVMDVDLDLDEQMILAKLYGKVGEEKEEEVEEAKKKAGEGEKEEEVEEAKKKAAQRPQAKKASVGPQKLGAVAKTASSGSDVDELSRLWTSAPDVSRHF